LSEDGQLDEIDALSITELLPERVLVGLLEFGNAVGPLAELGLVKIFDLPTWSEFLDMVVMQGFDEVVFLLDGFVPECPDDFRDPRTKGLLQNNQGSQDQFYFTHSVETDVC